MQRVCLAKRLAVGAVPLVAGSALLMVLVAGCSSKKGGTINCAAADECPNPLVCDLENGVCTDDDGSAYDCRPPLPGCACETGDNPINCLLPGQADDFVGSCREGRAICEGGVYSACAEAGNPFCSSVGGGSGDFDPDEDNSDQVTTGPEGELILDPDVKQIEFGFVWIANTGENTVSKIDIDTGAEVARYAAVRDSSGLGVPGVPSPGAVDGSAGNCANCPSRTAIDFKGDAFVANRAFGLQGTVTKFANAASDCIDRDGNGVIDTSFDVNADGIIDIDNSGEFLGESDECIVWTVPVGGNDGVPRGLAIDAGGPDGENGNVWVGLYNENRVIQISGDTGAPVQIAGSNVSVAVQDLSPYGLAVDGGGSLWATGIEDGGLTYLARVNTFQGTLTQIYPVPDDDDSCSKGYGISIDTSQRVWLAGWDCKDIKAFDQSTETFHRADFDDLDNTRGIALDTDGNVWVAFHQQGVGRFVVDDIINQGDAAPRTMFALPQPAGLSGDIDTTIGVGIDRNGACWAVSRNDNSPVGAATRIETDGTITSFPTGKNPYTYSDFTGFGLATVVRPNGYWRGLIEGCATTDGVTEWATLEWFENEPPGTSVRLRVRTADTVAGIDAAPWFGPWDDSPVDLMAEGVPAGKVMQIEVQLSTDDPAVTPAFIGFSVSFTCPGAPPVE